MAHFLQREELEPLSRPAVEFFGQEATTILGYTGHADPLGQILAKQAVGVLVGPSCFAHRHRTAIKATCSDLPQGVKVLIVGDSHMGSLKKGMQLLADRGALPTDLDLTLEMFGTSTVYITPFFENRSDHVRVTSTRPSKRVERLPPCVRDVRPRLLQCNAQQHPDLGQRMRRLQPAVRSHPGRYR